MARYKLIGGPHYTRDAEGNEVKYTREGPNSIVESDEDLVEKFPNKFELLPEEQRMTKKSKAQAEEPVQDDEEAVGGKPKKVGGKGKAKANPQDEDETDDRQDAVTDEDFFGDNTDETTKAHKGQVEPAESLHDRAKTKAAKSSEEGPPAKNAKPAGTARKSKKSKKS